MNKYILVFVMIFAMHSGFAQTEQYPSFMVLKNLSPFSPTYSVTDHSLCGIRYNLLNKDGKSIKPSLSEKCTNHFDKSQFANLELISLNFIVFLQSWSRTPISFPAIGCGYQQTYYRLRSTTFSNSPLSFQSNSCLLSLYGINQRLSDGEITSSQDMLHYEEPVFKASTLYREKVISDIIKQLRRQEYDFSGLIQEIYRPSHPF
jgi:hypothetical protein